MASSIKMGEDLEPKAGGDAPYIFQVDRSRIIARNEDILFTPVSPEGKVVHGIVKCIFRRKMWEWESELELPQEIDGWEDMRFLRSLDPAEWKEFDHYLVLGLSHLRGRATEDDIKKAYHHRVLKHHPDKRQRPGEFINPLGDYFGAIVKSYEVLSNPSRRRAFDSVDPEFDDSIPTVCPHCGDCQCPEEFFTTFGKWFSLNSKWSKKQPVPLLGNEFSTRAQVDHFYNFWFDFDSWREYSYLDEEEKEQGHCRLERRWIDKQNKIQRAELKKEEMARIRSVVEAAWKADPRLPVFRDMDKREKLEKKRARQRAIQEQYGELERKKSEEEQNRKLKEEEERRKQAEEKERLEQAARKVREAERKQMKKERKNLRTLCKANGYYNASGDEKSTVDNMASMEQLCEMLPVDELKSLNESLAKLSLEEASIEFGKCVEQMAQRISEEKLKSSQGRIVAETLDPGRKSTEGEEWSPDELQLLIKAVNLFPAGTVQRWQVVANCINEKKKKNEKVRSAKEVLAKAKDLNSTNFSKDLKEEANQKAYQTFERNLRGSPPRSAVPEEEVETKREEVVEANAPPSAPPTAWTSTEQKLLEQAIKTYSSTWTGGDRWDKIAECVPGRSRKECIARYKELAAMVKAKKNGKQAGKK